MTYTVSNVMSDVKIEVSSGEIYTVVYHVNAPTAGWQETIDEVPTIAGAAEYTITVQYNGDGTATYTLLSPSLTEVVRTVQGSGQTYKKSHFFDGWMSDQYGTEARFKAEEAALLSDIVALDTDGNKTIHLYGRWIDGALTQSLSYYINLSGEMMTYDARGAHASNDFKIDANKGWTDGIYGTHMSITPMFTNGYGGDNPADIYDNGGVILYDQTSTGKSNVDSEHTTDYVIVNTPIPDVDLTVKKVDDDGNALDGSEFQIKCGGNAYLYEEGNTSKIVPLIANSANGDAIHTIKVETSTDTYTINETTAPAGFYGLNGTISFKVTKGKVTDVSCPDGVQWDSNTNTFTVTNVPGVELPSTGGPGTFSYTIGGLLLMAASLLYGFGQRRKRERGDAI